MRWYALLPGEALTAARRPTTMVGAVGSLTMGFVLGLMAPGSLDTGAASLVGAMVFALGAGVSTAGVVVAILVGSGVGGEDHDLGTHRDLWLSRVGPMESLLCKLLVAVDLVVALALLLLGGGILAEVINILFRGGALWGEPFVGQTAMIWESLGEIVVLIPLVAIAAGCTASFLRSRLAGAVVWVGLYFIYLVSAVWIARIEALAGLVNFTPVGAPIALVKGRGWGGAASVRPSVALGVTVTWLVLFLVAAAWRTRRHEAFMEGHRRHGRATRFRAIQAQTASAEDRERAVNPWHSIRWSRHLVAAGCLALLLGAGGLWGTAGLLRAGADFDPVHQVLTNNLKEDYLERLADFLNAHEYEEARRQVGPAGEAGLALIVRELESGGDSRVAHGEQQIMEGSGSFGALYVYQNVDRAEGPVTTSQAFLVDLSFSEGTWRCLGISMSR